MSSAAPESESAELLPSQGRVSDHDPSGDERVVTVEPETAAAASSAAPSDASSPIGSKSDDMSGIVGPLKSTLEGLKFQIACMPVLRLKMLKTKSSRADLLHSDQKRVLILNGLVLSYYEPVKHTDFPNQKAKGYLPLWMLSKLEADVSSATPLVSLQYKTDTFIFKARKRHPDAAREFVTVQDYTMQQQHLFVMFEQELLRRSNLAQQSGIMTTCPSEPKWHAEVKLIVGWLAAAGA